MSVPPEEREAKARSSAIERQLRVDQREYENTIKILLLGELTFGVLLFEPSLKPCFPNLEM